jgi:murein tripeptide amidase MpaA
MKISDNVNQQEEEPEFKYISTMHGDEPVGTELLMYLINYLVDNYRTDSLVTYLVDNTEIWLMPLMNQDRDALHQRFNANGVDLNRNFRDLITDSTNTLEGREPETQTVMNFCSGHSFVSSANCHTGALVVNYPWDC